MTESQRKWLMYLQSKGVKFEWLTGHDRPSWKEFCARFDFNIVDGLFAFQFRISAQPIPDIPDWRELCREMQDKGIEFEAICGDGSWKKSRPYFFPDYMLKTDYRIPNQPIPEWREELNFEIEDTEYPKWSNEKMTEETKPDQKEEILHRELQIQWHKDKIRSLETGDPMRQWECRYEPGPWFEFGSAEKPTWQESHKYRRKPRTVTYWHCLVDYRDKIGINGILTSSIDDNDLLATIRSHRLQYPNAKYGPITETTVEVED